MRLSSFADYAVLVMRTVAGHCGAQMITGPRLNGARIATETALPLPTVQKIVGQLTRAGLLTTERGVGGGVRLARPAAAITIADIVEAIEGPIVLSQCHDADHNGACPVGARCDVRSHWPVVSAAVRGALAGIPLNSLQGAAA